MLGAKSQFINNVKSHILYDFEHFELKNAITKVFVVFYIKYF